MNRPQRTEFVSDGDYATALHVYAKWRRENITPLLERVRIEYVDRVVIKEVSAPAVSPETVEMMEAARAKINEATAAAVPSELAEHVKKGETVPQVKQRFLELYRDLGNKIHMQGLATDADRRLHESLHAKMSWIVSD